MVTGRTAWLARPWFFAAVAVLALNDHVLKQSWPGVVTGKLSDVAGLVVVATLASVLVGPAWGTALAGVGFTLLKTLPGVAEAAAPLLGGVTLRDPSDLVALAVLPPVWCVLSRERPDQRARSRRSWAVTGMVAAALATTATSQGIPHYVDLGSSDGVIYAEVDPGDGFASTLLATRDGGRTWAVERPAPAASAVTWDTERLDGSRGTQVCAADRTCYRIRHDPSSGTAIERSVADAGWQPDGLAGLPYSGDLAVDPANAGHVVVAGTERTVYVRAGAGEWRRVDLDQLAAPPPWQREAVDSLQGEGTPILVLVLVSLLCWLVVPWLAVRVTLQVLNIGVCGLAFVTGLMFTPLAHATLIGSWIGVTVVLVAVMRLSWWLDQRTPRARPGPGDPPWGRR